MISAAEVNDWFLAGIDALKAGDRAEAQRLLLQVVTADEQHEAAWLWLSGAVDSVAEQRICLENVLTLNPTHELAQKGLVKLAGVEAVVGETAVAHPSPPSPVIKNSSGYTDIWEQDDDLCAFCAHPIQLEEVVCPRCRSQLVVSSFRYAEPSANLHILWVLLAGLAQLYFIQALYDVIAQQNIFYAIWPIVLGIFFMALTGGVYYRHFWAYVGALALLSLILFINVLGFFIPATLTPAALIEVGPMFDDVINPMLDSLGDLLRIFQLMAVIFALFFAAVKAGPDFDRVKQRRLATLTKGLREPGSFHAAAIRASKKGEWATAVLHWQRAAALAPTQATFQRHLGAAYARLGFYQRSQDVLQTAVALTHHPDQKNQLLRLLETVQRQSAAPQPPKETAHE